MSIQKSIIFFHGYVSRKFFGGKKNEPKWRLTHENLERVILEIESTAVFISVVKKIKGSTNNN